jgi:hypothetical protein
MRPLPHLTATSAADPSRQSSASITITSNFTLQIAAPANLAPGVTSATVATTTPVPGSRARGASAGCTFGLCRGLCSLTGITKSIVCLWAAVIKSTPSRWVAPLRRRRVTNDAGHALPQCHDWTLCSPRVRGLELAIHKDCGVVGESLSLEGLSYRNVVATAHAIQSTKHLGNCGD